MNQQAYIWGIAPNAIRALAMYGWERAAKVGAENIYDFSIGNPSVPAPDAVRAAAKQLLDSDPVELHGYSPAMGNVQVRQALCADLNRRFQANVSAENMYLTCGATAAMCCTFHGLFNAGDEIMTISPYFPEYSVFPKLAGMELVAVDADRESFQPDFEALERAFTAKTKAFLINSPNNPTGVVYTSETLTRLAELLRRKSAEYGNTIYLISDEPYRELVFEGESAPWIPHFYDDTIVCYSFSKSLSMPGERIGYYLVPPTVKDWKAVYDACAGAGRALGYICAPTLFQKTVADCLGETADLSVYADNLKRFAPALRELGYEVAQSRGAFYLFMKSPSGDGAEFSERAKKYDVLVVPSDTFGMKGYVRLSYCVPKERIERALPQFAKLREEYRALGM